MDIQEVILKVLDQKEAGQEYNQLKDWKNETAENLKLYQEINKIVEEGSNLSEHRDYDVESGYARFKQQISSPSKSWLAYAAAALLLIGASYFIFANKQEANTIEAPKAYLAESGVEAFDLKDGSTITLNVGAELKELSNFSKVRKVDLQGEAFFDIQSDEDRPFRIMLEENTFVEVLGTSFNILNDGENLKVVVESGHVELHTEGKTISLTAGYAAERVQGSIVKFRKTKDNYLSWMNNKLTYKNTPITEVLEEISSHFGADLQISEMVQSSNCKLSSKFDTESLDQILSELSKLVDLSYTKATDGSYSIKDIKCE